jgi:NAD(P)-dependent dehydrogenase (short-subunit alcohol dehydrogenase family)
LNPIFHYSISTAGIGFATARALVGEGATFAMNGRTGTRVNSAVERIRSEMSGAIVDGIPTDLSSGDGCRALIDQLPEVDMLVNNLGIFKPKTFETISCLLEKI